jgi:hypothetical protein
MFKVSKMNSTWFHIWYVHMSKVLRFLKSKLYDVYLITNVQKFMVLSTNYTLSLKVSQINYDWHTFKVAMFHESNAINTFSKFHLVGDQMWLIIHLTSYLVVFTNVGRVFVFESGINWVSNRAYAYVPTRPYFSKNPNLLPT